MQRPLIAGVIAILVAAGGLAAPATAASGGPNNVALATTTAGSTSDAQSRMQVGSYGGDTLDSTNLAQAYSHDCAGCHTVAVAVQAVFATGHPSTVTPTNTAAAVNANCTQCATFAFAYQYVVTTDGPVYLTDAGREELANLREKFAAAAHSDMSFSDLDTRLHDLAADFKADINAQVRHAGETPDGVAHLDVQQAPG